MPWFEVKMMIEVTDEGMSKERMHKALLDELRMMEDGADGYVSTNVENLHIRLVDEQREHW